MERYFSVNKESDLYREWFKFDDNRKRLNAAYNDFCKEMTIESNEYGIEWNALYIKPTEKDLKQFASQFQVKDYGDGARQFKKNSKVYKAWIKKLEDRNLEIISKPSMWHYFGAYGRSNSRIFDDNNGNVYCSIEAEYLEKKIEGVTEIKASEFFKVIEDIQGVISNCSSVA